MKGRFTLKLAIIALAVLGPAFAFAQNQTFSVRQSPENPNPGETVFLNISAYEFNVDLAKITWSLDGKAKDSGVGKRAFSFVAPANGKTSSVDIEVVPQNGKAIKQTLSFTPADIDILWEALDSYTPPFYPGKSLPISQSQVKVVAVPVVKNANGTHRKTEDFVFTWRKDGKNFPGQSGLGKNGFSFANQILDKQNRVDVSATDGAKTVSGSVIITPFESEILFYEEHSLEGIQYQNTLDIENNLKKPRLKIVAEPYFLSKNFKTNPDISFEWSINNASADKKWKQYIIVDTSTTTGTISLTAKYKDSKKLFRTFTESMSINNN